jgi:quercetin dioxygenase-like cupin family protein
MVSRIHRVEQHRSAVPGIEPMTLVSNHHFPRHSHDQFGIGVIVSGAQRSWSGVGQVSASAGDVIMANPGEMHDGVPLDSNGRRWRMIYIDPSLVASELRARATALRWLYDPETPFESSPVMVWPN